MLSMIKNMTKQFLESKGIKLNWRLYEWNDPEHFDPEVAEKYRQDYAESLGFGKHLKNAEVMNNFINNRSITLQDLGKVEVNDKPLDEQLKAAKEEDIKALNQIINNALKPEDDDEIKRLQEQYNKELKAINDTITDGQFKPSAMEKVITDLKQKTHKQFADINNRLLDELMKKPEFKTQLNDELNIKDDKALDVIKTGLKKSLDEKLEKAFKPLYDSHEAIHHDQQKERDRITFLGALYNNNKAMRDLIDEMAVKNAKDNEAGVAIALEDGENGTSAIFKGINVKDIAGLQSLTGRPIIQNEKKPGEFEMTLPGTFAGILSSGWNKTHDLKKDLQSIAMAVRASGYKKITMEIENNDGAKAKEIAREAYKACRVAGYPADKIIIKVNNQVMQIKFDETKAFKNDDEKKTEIGKTLFVTGTEKKTLAAFEDKMKLLDEKTANFKKQHNNTSDQAALKEKIKHFREHPKADTVDTSEPRPSSPAA